MVCDLIVARALVGAAIGDHAADQRFGFGRGCDLAGRRLAAGARDEREHPAVRRVMEEAARVLAEKRGLRARGDFLAHRRNEPPGSDQPVAQLVVSRADIRFPPRIRFPSKAMRAEIQAIVDDIKQSVGLLRRHL